MSEELKTKLKELGLTDDMIAKLEAEGAKNDAHIAGLTAEQIKAITGCGLITAMDIAKAFLPAPVTVAPEAAASEALASMDILPSVPDDKSYIEALKVGGVLKVQPKEVISAMKAAIASRMGLYGLSETILKKIEQFAENQEDPVGEEYYELQKIIAERKYAEVLQAIGATTRIVTQGRKDALLVKLDSEIWDALRGFQNMLVSWQDAWMKGMANPGTMVTMLAMGTAAKNMLPPGMMAPPETDGLRDEAEAVINRINKVFAGTGIPVAAALALDAMKVKEVLENPKLPAAIGATNREQMLKMLGVTVGSDIVRLERNITRYALAIMELPKVTSGNEELAYLGAMITLGSAIPWDKLNASAGEGGAPQKRKTFPSR